MEGWGDGGDPRIDQGCPVDGNEIFAPRGQRIYFKGHVNLKSETLYPTCTGKLDAPAQMGKQVQAINLSSDSI